MEAQSKSLNDILASLESLIGSNGVVGTSGFSAMQIANNLFKKAAPEEVNKFSSSELREIVANTSEALSQYSQPRSRPYTITTKQMKDYSCLVLVIQDAPFIVSSSLLQARSLNLDIVALFHPIISIGSENISLSQMIVHKISDAKLADLAQAIERAMTELILVTSDHQAMCQEIRQASALLKSGLSTGLATNQAMADNQETLDLLDWLVDNNFLFLGVERIAAVPSAQKKLGIFKSIGDRLAHLNAECSVDINQLRESKKQILITKLSTTGFIHRKTRPTHIAVPLDSSGKEFLSIVGVLSSRALLHEAKSIPFIRQKLAAVLAAEEAVHNSYAYKFIVDTMDRMHKDDLLRLSQDDIRRIVARSFGFYSKDSVRAVISRDTVGRGITVLAIVPRDSYRSQARDLIQRHLESAFNLPLGSSEYHVDLSFEPMARLYVQIAVPSDFKLCLTEEYLSDECTRITSSWGDRWGSAIVEELEAQSNIESSPLRLINAEERLSLLDYKNIFPESYKAATEINQGVVDALVLRTLSESNPVEVIIELAPRESIAEAAQLASSSDIYNLSIYLYDHTLSTSSAIPIIEHCGLDVITTDSYNFTPLNRSLHRYAVTPQNPAAANFSKLFTTGLGKIVLGIAEEDAMNKLLASGELDTRAVQLLRSYSCYLYQANKFATRSSIFDALATNPGIAIKIWKLFCYKFDPALNIALAERNERCDILRDEIKEDLRKVSEIAKDRIIRAIISIIDCTVRTNFFQGSPAISFKMHAKKLDLLPQPRPLFEIYSRSPNFEGIHLRGSNVARGGIRWSERPDDFRNEVYGLMKTQMVKNVLIVPSGAKGGFVVRHLPKDPQEVPRAVANCYREFIDSCLALADNRKDGDIVQPKNLVIYDEVDPYFVVAADKGTATFSDLANRLACEQYDFWLGDAFASGGSNGYDHKKYGITAKGAWECVIRHFKDIGIKFETEPFSVVGIGDMSGDVFGNGLIISDKAKLLAAFNHKHIFIDPNPDPARSYAERVRLFNLPRSQWSDYSSELISKGGGIFSRYDKELRLSTEARSALGISDDLPTTLSGEEVIAHILRAPVDLLWNGGIGTYVKAQSESHADVLDSGNDGVRINANELRAKVIGEGGNLGFTQKARIEYSLLGGRANTDAIDNSGGVDLSDHEVNLKILLKGLVGAGKITIEERNQLLLEMAPDVVEDVLSHNRSHAVALTLSAERSRKNISYMQPLLRTLNRVEIIRRQQDNLPDDEELSRRASRGLGMTRPELALCFAAVKMWIKSNLRGSELLTEPVLTSRLMAYFPRVIQKNYATEIKAHPLAQDIIATQITGSIVDTVGLTFLQRTSSSYSVDLVTSVKCCAAAEELLGLVTLREQLKLIDTAANCEAFLEARKLVGRCLRSTASWLVGSHPKDTLSTIVGLYERDFNQALHTYNEFCDASEIAAIKASRELYSGLGLPEDVVNRLAIYPVFVQHLDILWCAREAGCALADVGHVYGAVAQILRVKEIKAVADQVEATNKWEHQLLITALEDINRQVTLLSTNLIKRGFKTKPQIEQILASDEQYPALEASLEDFLQGPKAAAPLAILARGIRLFTV